ncbi:hypothetical protein MKW98_014323 [Papaver atlanticum]|uniref:TF-B3 domain-containing protein n=1 Tax=Papaver atlanticum TaxID=357466 RepID=A0AAD4SQ93_9MAGN|nr:hypothetical protein MKW98_014323 [Papaver atlanticum]
MDKGKAKMVEEEKEREEEEAPMDVDGDESKQGNEEIEVHSSHKTQFDTMTSLQRSLPARKGTATSDDANPRKRKPSIPSIFKFGEKSLKISSDKGERINLFRRRVPPSTDASSPKGNTKNTASSASISQDTASSPPPPPQQNHEVHMNEQVAGERINLFRRRVPPSTDASSPKGNTENTASSATLAQDTVSLPPPATSSSNEVNNHYLQLVDSYLSVFDGSALQPEGTPSDFKELIHCVRRSLDDTGDPVQEELKFDCDDYEFFAVLKGPMGCLFMNLEQLKRAYHHEHPETVEIEGSVKRVPRVSTMKILTRKDVKPKADRLRFLQPFALKLKSLLNPPESVEAGVEVKVFNNQLRTFNVKLKSYNGKVFLFRGWGRFLRKNEWVAKMKSIKISAFRHFESGDLSFLILPA